jgi:hypothetical protein
MDLPQIHARLLLPSQAQGFGSNHSAQGLTDNN